MEKKWKIDGSKLDATCNLVFLTHCIVCECACSVAQACPSLCSPMDCNLPGSSINGIFQARVLEWVAISFSRGSSRSIQGSNLPLLCLLHWQVDSLPLAPPGKPQIMALILFFFFLALILVKTSWIGCPNLQTGNFPTKTQISASSWNWKNWSNSGH